LESEEKKPNHKTKRVSAETYNKNMAKVSIFYFENEFLPQKTSENWTLNVLSGL
jgi:hypothetical protein